MRRTVTDRFSNDPAVPEFLRVIPRPIRRRPRTIVRLHLLRLILLPFMLMGVAAVGAMVGITVWLAFGSDVEAVVDRVVVTHPQRGRSTYHVVYHYDAHGPRGTGRGEIADTQLGQIADPGLRHVHVRAVGVPPLAFSDVVPRGARGWGKAIGIWVGGGLLVAAGAVAFFFAFVLPRRQRRLYQTGDAAPGEIVRKVHGLQGKIIAVSLLYEFKDADGQVVRNNLSTPRGVWNAANEGDKITVLFDPKRPGRNIAYEYGDYYVPG